MPTQKLPVGLGSNEGKSPTSAMLRAPGHWPSWRARGWRPPAPRSRARPEHATLTNRTQTATLVVSRPEGDQAQAGRNPAGGQADQDPGDRRPEMPEDGQDDQRRGDELAAVHHGHPRVGQEQVTRRHRHARDRPLEVPPADQQEAGHEPTWARIASTRATMTWGRSCFSEEGSGAFSMTCWTAALCLVRVGTGDVPDPRDPSARPGSGRPLLDGQADRLGQEQAEHPDRQAEEPRRIEVRLEQRATRQAQVEQAADQPERRAQEEPDEGRPGVVGLVARRSASSPARARTGAGGRGSGRSRSG